MVNPQVTIVQYVLLNCFVVPVCVIAGLQSLYQKYLKYLLSSPLSPIIPIFLPPLLPYDSFHPDKLQHRTVIAACLPLVN